MFNFGNYDERLISAIEKYMPSPEKEDKAYIKSVLDDIIDSKERYKLDKYTEYFKYGFLNMPEEKRSTFFGGKDYKRCVVNSFNGSYENCTIFKNKLDTFDLFKPYYKRDVIGIKGFDDYSTFLEFTKRNRVFIAKQAVGSLGMNIKKFTIASEDEIKPVFFSLLQFGECICESWIKQCDAFAQFCESSVNTVRIATVFDDRGLIKVYGMFRTGRDGSIVDNASIGGIASEIDLETGMVISDGYTKTSFEHFEFHPNSGKKFKGFIIPKWDELLVLIGELHRVHKDSRYVGWDLTLTDDGWVLIEGNGKPNIDTIQMINYNTFGYGLYDVIDNALGRYRNK